MGVIGLKESLVSLTLNIYLLKLWYTLARRKHSTDTKITSYNRLQVQDLVFVVYFNKSLKGLNVFAAPGIKRRLANHLSRSAQCFNLSLQECHFTLEPQPSPTKTPFFVHTVTDADGGR